jgi:hypothetical protein
MITSRKRNRSFKEVKLVTGKSLGLSTGSIEETPNAESRYDLALFHWIGLDFLSSVLNCYNKFIGMPDEIAKSENYSSQIWLVLLRFLIVSKKMLSQTNRFIKWWCTSICFFDKKYEFVLSSILQFYFRFGAWTDFRLSTKSDQAKPLKACGLPAVLLMLWWAHRLYDSQRLFEGTMENRWNCQNYSWLIQMQRGRGSMIFWNRVSMIAWNLSLQGIVKTDMTEEVEILIEW